MRMIHVDLRQSNLALDFPCFRIYYSNRSRLGFTGRFFKLRIDPDFANPRCCRIKQVCQLYILTITLFEHIFQGQIIDQIALEIPDSHVDIRILDMPEFG